MSNNSPSRTVAAVLRDLHSFTAEPPPDVDAISENEICAELKKRNINPVSSFLAMHELIDEEIAVAELAIARQQRLHRLESVESTAPFFGAGLREKIHNLIQSLNPQAAQAYFSKFESAPEEDLQSLYDDLVALRDQSAKGTDDGKP